MKRFLPILFFLIYIPAVGFRIEEGDPGKSEPAAGYIDIEVKSNVNIVNFTYALAGNTINEEFDQTSVGTNSGMASIVVPVKEFRSNNELALQDFQTLLRADQYPDLKIVIPQSVLMQLRPGEQVTVPNILITIAGVSKKYDITCSVENPDSKGYILVGSIKVRLTDLSIDPPVKYFGLVKIKDEVIVKFGFSLNDNNLALNKDSN
jgi:hypothetical protein